MKESVGRDSNREFLWRIAPRSVPFSLGITPSDICNFRCNFCNQSTPQGIKDARILPWDDFCTLAGQIKELSDLGNTRDERIRNIRFIGNGEPLINKRLPDMIAYLKDMDIADRFEVTTNASLLTHEMSDRLVASGITRLLISVEGLTKEKYKKICGYSMNIEKLIENISYFYSIRKDAKVFIKTVNIALDSKDDEQKFYDMFKPVCDEIAVENIINACADVDYSKITDEDISSTTRYGTKFVRKICCDTLFMYLNIHSNGDADCCGCIYPPLYIGNIYNTPLKDLWNGEKHKEIMKLHLEKRRVEIPTCRNCGSINGYNGFSSDNLDGHLDEVLARLEKMR